MTTPISARTNAVSPGTTRPKAAGPTRNPPSELTDDRWLSQPPGDLLADLAPTNSRKSPSMMSSGAPAADGA